MANTTSDELLHGTLDTLILKTLSWGPRHGYAIARWIETSAGAAIGVEDGSLYPALYRLERRKLIDAEWGSTDTGRRAKFYGLTRTGRAQLRRRAARWAEFSAAVSRILLTAE
jgi:PadR family transcriptional regulator PadR